MRLADVNVLVYAFREDAPDHARYRDWLETHIRTDEPFGISDTVLAGFLRVVTHPRVFNPPTPLAIALKFVTALKDLPNAVPLRPGPRHWDIFVRLCKEGGAKGNLVPDAWLAALAIEAGAEWVTADRDYRRFPGLRVHHPLA